MGKGDKKSRKGKIAIGSYGVRRLRKSGNKNVVPVAEPTEKATEKKSKTKKK